MENYTSISGQYSLEICPDGNPNNLINLFRREKKKHKNKHSLHKCSIFDCTFIRIWNFLRWFLVFVVAPHDFRECEIHSQKIVANLRVQ